jgi:hypothetical protein
MELIAKECIVIIYVVCLHCIAKNGLIRFLSKINLIFSP